MTIAPSRMQQVLKAARLMQRSGRLATDYCFNRDPDLDPPKDRTHIRRCAELGNTRVGFAKSRCSISLNHVSRRSGYVLLSGHAH